MNPCPTRSRSTRLARRLLSLSLFVAGAALWDPVGASASAPVAPVAAASGMVTLPGSLHPWVRGGTDLGRMDPVRHMTGMSLLLKPSASQKVLLDKTLLSLQDPTSPSYHQWLSPEEYAARFGASPADIARASEWLTSQGLTVDGPSRASTRLSFSGSVADVERAFVTEMHRYTVDGAEHYAMSQAPSIPSELASFVLGLHAMHNFRPTAPRHEPRPQYAFPFPTEDGGTVIQPALAPADFAAIYDVNALYTAGITGTGQKIAVAEQTDFNDVDVATFRSTFGLSVNPPVRVLVANSGPALVADPGDLGEAELDTEWSGAIAKDATIEYVFTGATDNNGATDALIYAIEQDTAPLISLSYGSCESGVTPSDAVFYEVMGDAAAMMGITVLVASGDTGAAGCDFRVPAHRGEYVGLPASVPSIVAVGGTQFQLTPANVSTYFDTNLDALGYIPESGWNETVADEVDGGFNELGASTGGASVVFSKPYWQVPYTPQDKARDVPDVALTTSVDIMAYITYGSWTAADADAAGGGTLQPESAQPVGGTSCAAPSFAAILALVNQAMAKAQPNAPTGLGNVNPVLYALANNAASAAAFHDVTTGDNIQPCESGSPSCPTTPPLQYGYTCGPGYDQVTGLGSVDAAKLVAAWTTLTPTSTTLKVTPSGTAEGSTLQLDATVASLSTTSGMTGSVTFYFETFDSMGNLDLGGTLGAVPLTPTTSGNEGGTASLTATVPGGATGSAKVGAVYGGDVHYLTSWSALSEVTAKSTLAICPTAVTMAPGQTGLTFTTTGGVPPITLTITDDNSCAPEGHMFVCSTLDDAGVFTAGPQAGAPGAPVTVTIAAVDRDDSYVTSTVTVAGTADSGAPLPTFNCVPDAGAEGGADASLDAAADARGADAEVGDGGNEPGTVKGGCGCVTAGGGEGMAVAWWGGVLLGLAAFCSRRRRGRRQAA